MVRFDVFRLASVVERYTNCLRAIMVRLVLDPEIDRMPIRQHQMQKRLAEAIQRLKKLLKHRQGIRPDLSDDVERFVKFVIWDAQRAREEVAILLT